MTAVAVDRRRLRRLVRNVEASDAEGTASFPLRPRGLAHVLLAAIAAFFVSFVAWAANAPLDEVTRGDGRVIPSRQIQKVQNLEGGILAALTVREGEVVVEGQVLMRIDNVRAASDLGESRARWLALSAASARLEAEVQGSEPSFPAMLEAEAGDLVAAERASWSSRRLQLASDTAVLERQARQREQEIDELRSRRAQLASSLALADQELELARGAAAKRALPRAEMQRIERDNIELRGELEQTALALPRAQAALEEAQARLGSSRLTFEADARGDLAGVKAELAALREVLNAGEDQVRRTEVRSPVRGVVKVIEVTTLGGVIQPGQDLAEIVPLDDTRLIEAQVRPADIAFIAPGHPAVVKVTAYDYAIYGGLTGTVEEISADTVEDDRKERFYRVRVRTRDNALEQGGRQLAIIPGMTAQIDVLTGKKTVLDYLMKPILKARGEALRER